MELFLYEKALSKVAPPPPEYILITCINEFLVSNCAKAFLKHLDNCCLGYD